MVIERRIRGFKVNPFRGNVSRSGFRRRNVHGVFTHSQFFHVFVLVDACHAAFCNRSSSSTTTADWWSAPWSSTTRSRWCSHAVHCSSAPRHAAGWSSPNDAGRTSSRTPPDATRYATSRPSTAATAKAARHAASWHPAASSGRRSAPAAHRCATAKANYGSSGWWYATAPAGGFRQRHRRHSRSRRIRRSWRTAPSPAWAATGASGTDATTYSTRRSPADGGSRHQHRWLSRSRRIRRC